MIPVVAPPLFEPPARLRRFRGYQESEVRATPPAELIHATDDRSGDCRTSSRWLSRHRRDRRWSPRGSAPAVLMCLSAAAGLAAALIRRKHEGASS
jgi:hypothetical protein